MHRWAGGWGGVIPINITCEGKVLRAGLSEDAVAALLLRSADLGSGLLARDVDQQQRSTCAPGTAE